MSYENLTVGITVCYLYSKIVDNINYMDKVRISRHSHSDDEDKYIIHVERRVKILMCFILSSIIINESLLLLVPPPLSRSS
jgi:hypothetical protein